MRSVIKYKKEEIVVDRPVINDEMLICRITILLFRFLFPILSFAIMFNTTWNHFLGYGIIFDKEMSDVHVILLVSIVLVTIVLTLLCSIEQSFKMTTSIFCGCMFMAICAAFNNHFAGFIMSTTGAIGALALSIQIRKIITESKSSEV